MLKRSISLFLALVMCSSLCLIGGPVKADEIKNADTSAAAENTPVPAAPEINQEEKTSTETDTPVPAESKTSESTVQELTTEQKAAQLFDAFMKARSCEEMERQWHESDEALLKAMTQAQKDQIKTWYDTLAANVDSAKTEPKTSDQVPAEDAPAVKDSAVKDPAVKDPAVKDPAVKDPAVKDPAVKDPAVKDPAVKDPAVKDPAVKDPAVKDPAENDQPESAEPPAPLMGDALNTFLTGLFADFETLNSEYTALTKEQKDSLTADQIAAIEAKLAELKVPFEASKAVMDKVLAVEGYQELKDACAALTEEEKAQLLPKHAKAIEAEIASRNPLYVKLMACTNIDDLEVTLYSASEEEQNTLTEAQWDEIDARFTELATTHAAPKEEAPAEPEAPMESEGIIPTQNVTYVAPFRAPVSGKGIRPLKQPRMLMAGRRNAVPYAEPRAEEKDNGVTVDKTAAPKPGTDLYTITLEAYATGDKIITETTEDVPTDIVLVLDQSGSMGDEMETSGGWNRYLGTQRRNENLYSHRANGGDGKMYYKAEDGKFYQVSVDKKEVTEGGTPGTDETREVYEKCKTLFGTNRSNSWYYGERTNLWALKNGKYEQVTVTKSGNDYTYTLADGTVIATSSKGHKTPTFTNVDEDALFQHKTVTEHIPGEPGVTTVTYTYSYTPKGKPTVEIGKSVGNRTEFSTDLWYEGKAGTTTRIAALTNALNLFTDSVKSKAMGPDGKVGGGDDINHRIAVVGFAGGKHSSSQYKNSELFIGADQYNYEYLGMKESSNSKNASKFKSAFQNMNETAGQANVAASIGALQAEGATNTHYGMEMAQKVLSENPVKGGEKRNRVVIVFTDGAPNYKNGFILDVANSAIGYSNSIKGTGTTVYGVGIFNGADGADPGKKPGSDLDSDDFPESGSTTAGKNACNWFMQNVSSNNGKPQKPSYYLSASNASGLDSIFEQIAGQIESGGSTSSLTQQAVIKDIVAPQFELPAGTTAKDIHINTYKYLGGDQKNPASWKLDNSARGSSSASLSTGTDAATGETVNKVDVTDFDYAKHYVGTETVNGVSTPRGYKLVITFDVKAKDAFFGGNQVPTNTKAELFEKDGAEKPVEIFPVPKVDVPVKPITFNVPDTYVYLNGSVNKEAMRSHVVVKVGEYTLDMNKGAEGNWGMQPWQVEYVNIHTPNDIGQFLNLKEDQAVEIHLDITPKTSGTATGHDATTTANIRVIKPVLTWKDSQLDLGQTAEYETQNFVMLEWKYGDQLNTTPVIYDNIVDGRGKDAPTLTYHYDPAAAAFPEDTPVKVGVIMAMPVGEAFDATAYTTFLHEDCHFEGCQWADAQAKGFHFIVHIKSFDLIIDKVVNGAMNSNDSFYFHITGNGYSNDVIINGDGEVRITGLKSGTYTITEDQGWSWTYTCDNPTQTVSPADAQGGVARVTFTNTPKTDIPLSEETHVDNRWIDGIDHK